MSTALIRNPSPVLTEFDQLLESMIGLQKKEQELILARRTDDLATTTQSIEWMGLKMQSMEIEVRNELEAMAGYSPEKPRSVQDKIAQIRRLALQNRTLLEHSLFFCNNSSSKSSSATRRFISTTSTATLSAAISEAGCWRLVFKPGFNRILP